MIIIDCLFFNRIYIHQDNKHCEDNEIDSTELEKGNNSHDDHKVPLHSDKVPQGKRNSSKSKSIKNKAVTEQESPFKVSDDALIWPVDESGGDDKAIIGVPSSTNENSAAQSDHEINNAQTVISFDQFSKGPGKVYTCFENFHLSRHVAVMKPNR